jgi:polyisoprenoid-binding protein YceI
VHCWVAIVGFLSTWDFVMNLLLWCCGVRRLVIGWRLASWLFFALAASWVAQPLAMADERVATADDSKPVPIDAGTAKLNQQNTCIEFVGIHTGDDPKPRLGGFKQFEGVLVIQQGKLTAVSIEIAVGSIWTEFDKLTQHLQAADFLGVEQHPTATFRSTSVVAEGANVKITGIMKLHGTESEIAFPAKVKLDDKGVVLESKFSLDRTAFGMNDHLDGVDKLVSVTVIVGKATPGLDKKRNDAAAKQAPRATAEQPLSGLAVGQSIEPWTPVHVSGPDKGTKTCPLCTYLQRPAIVVFAKDGPNTEKLLAKIEQMLGQHSDDDLKGFVAVLDASPQRCAELAASQRLLLTAVCYPDSKTGPKDLAAYNISPGVDNTVLVYKNYKVVKNFVNLDVGQSDQLAAAVDSMLQ